MSIAFGAARRYGNRLPDQFVWTPASEEPVVKKAKADATHDAHRMADWRRFSQITGFRMDSRGPKANQTLEMLAFLI